MYIQYQKWLFGQISLQKSPRQELFWVPAGFESTEKSVMLLDAQHWLAAWNKLIQKLNMFLNSKDF